ncbi:MAG TPA: pyridoxamine 5'-phosphate oxidase [Acidobacteriaceae bacterium]|nr:pyridoxamine 5'-phosphate oxidase [Acidobacteriaceae bacterium]
MTLRPELQTNDPIQLVRDWLTLATSSEPNDPNAAALATASPDGLPNVRMVLVKGIDAEGFSFYTNEESQKGQEMRANPRAALCLHWKSLRRQIRTRGSVINLPDAVTDHYFHSRGRRSQIGAAVSRQSRPLPSREHLEREVAAFEQQYKDGEIPRPSFWRGYLLRPESIEFWIDGPDRLHDRLSFTRTGDAWQQTLLYP